MATTTMYSSSSVWLPAPPQPHRSSSSYGRIHYKPHHRLLSLSSSPRPLYSIGGRYGGGSDEDGYGDGDEQPERYGFLYHFGKGFKKALFRQRLFLPNSFIPDVSTVLSLGIGCLIEVKTGCTSAWINRLKSLTTHFWNKRATEHSRDLKEAQMSPVMVAAEKAVDFAKLASEYAALAQKDAENLAEILDRERYSRGTGSKG